MGDVVEITSLPFIERGLVRFTHLKFLKFEKCFVVLMVINTFNSFV